MKSKVLTSRTRIAVADIRECSPCPPKWQEFQRAVSCSTKYVTLRQVLDASGPHGLHWLLGWHPSPLFRTSGLYRILSRWQQGQIYVTSSTPAAGRYEDSKASIAEGRKRVLAWLKKNSGRRNV